MKLRIKDSSNSVHGLKLVGMFIEQNKELYLGSNDVDSLYDRIKAEYPHAKLSKCKGYVLIGGKEG